MIEFVNIQPGDIGLLQNFIVNMGDIKASFRYYNSRDTSVLSNHLLTALLTENGKPVCYGHLDREGGEVWLGIATLKMAQGKGYGRKMMYYLLEFAVRNKISSIVLTVDNDNLNARKLYESLGFVKERQADTYTLYRKLLA